MKLTGKALNDFEMFLSENYGSFKATAFQECASAPEYEVFFDEIILPKSVEKALIIEFFDSIKCAGFKSLWSYTFGNGYDPFLDNWNEHIEKAIEKANLIYNDRV